MAEFTGDWEALQQELLQRLETMGVGVQFRLGEPPAPRPSGLLRQRRSEPRRYVQFIAGPDVITAECVGSTTFGGEWSMSGADESSLERLGWAWPLNGTSPHFRQHRRRVEAMWLAESVVGALQLLDADPAGLEFTETAQELARSRR